MKKLLCLNVEILSAFEKTKPTFFHSIPTPAICSAFVTTTMIDSINGALQLIEENNLVEVVYHASDVNWFSSLDKIIYQTINSSLHVTKESIFYSGAFAPQKEPAFVSMRLPLSCITPTSHPPATKELNLSFLSTDTAQELIDEIENLEREMNIATDRYESLEELSNAIEGLKTASILAKSNKTNALAHEVSIELKLLMKATEVHEMAVQEKCEILCKRILNVSIGDRIITVSPYKKKSLEIQIESVRYYNGTMYIDGPKVLKNGSLGKRSETAYISLVHEDEHQ